MNGELVIFQTNTEIDIKAFTTFGISAKPNSDNPIGYFGTGLKYAIAVLVRNNQKVRLFIGNHEYEFYVKESEFRNKQFPLVMMRHRKSILRRWASRQLPFTTELGKNWEIWQAFRELESNTRDEGGTSGIYSEGSVNLIMQDEVYPGRTTIVVTGEEFAEAYHDMDNVFLPKGLRQRDSEVPNNAVQIIKAPSNHIYYRGLRVYDLDKPSMYTYNILQQMDLTEDRTLKYEFLARSVLTSAIAKSEDPQLVDAVMDADPDKFYEAKFDFDDMYDTPSTTFVETLRKRKESRQRILPRALTYWDRYQEPVSPQFKDKFRYRINPNDETTFEYLDRETDESVFIATFDDVENEHMKPDELLSAINEYWESKNDA